MKIVAVVATAVTGRVAVVGRVRRLTGLLEVVAGRTFTNAVADHVVTLTGLVEVVICWTLNTGVVETLVKRMPVVAVRSLCQDNKPVAVVAKPKFKAPKSIAVALAMLSASKPVAVGVPTSTIG